MATLAEMAAQGEAKLTAKATSMGASWTASKDRMKAGYGRTPFGATWKSNFNARVDAAVYKAPDPAKWRRNWLAKMAE